MSSSAAGLTFVDASGWIALVNRHDTLHQECVQPFQQRLGEGQGLITSSVVLLEVGNWLSPFSSRRLASELYERIRRSQCIEVVELTSDLFRKGCQLYGHRLDKDWGVIDCISFTIMQERGITDALTADRHFEQAGFTPLLK